MLALGLNDIASRNYRMERALFDRSGSLCGRLRPSRSARLLPFKARYSLFDRCQFITERDRERRRCLVFLCLPPAQFVAFPVVLCS